MGMLELKDKLSHVWKLGNGDIPLWAVSVLQQEVIYYSVKGKQIALGRKRIAELFCHDNGSTTTSKFLHAEHLALCQKRALDYIESLHTVHSSLSCEIAIKIHSLLFGTCIGNGMVQFRDKNFCTADGLNTAVHFTDIKKHMATYDLWLKSQQEKETDLLQLPEILQFAARAHVKLIHIHPFSDGNGRTARLFLNAILRNYKLPYAVLPKVRSSAVVKDAIINGIKGDIRPFCEMLENFLSESCDRIVRHQAKYPRR